MSTQPQPLIQVPGSVDVQYALPTTGFTTIKARVSTILSVSPFPQAKTMLHGFGIYTYTIPPAEKSKIITRTCNPALQAGNEYALENPAPFLDEVTPSSNGRGYVLYHVYDAQHLVKDIYSDSIRLIPQIIPASDITQALTQHWSSFYPVAGRSTPGIAVLNIYRDLDSQLNEQIERQRDYAAALIVEADMYAAQREYKLITNVHRVFAQWMGTEERDWFQEIAERRMKDCPACGESILAKALKCVHCNEFLPTFYVQNHLPLTAQIDEAVYNFAQRGIVTPYSFDVEPSPATSANAAKKGK